MLRHAAALLLGTAFGAAVVLLASGHFRHAPPEPARNFGRSTQATFPVDSSFELDTQGTHIEPATQLVAIARRSPAAALMELAALGPATRRAALAEVARTLMSDDPILALRLVERVRANVRGEIYDALLTQWSLDDPAAAVAWLSSLDSTRARTELFDRELGWPETLAAAAPELVFETAQTIPGDHGSMLRQAAMGALAQRDPVAAAALALTAATRTDRDRYANSVGLVLGAHDPTAAVEWLRGMEEPNWNVVQTTLGGIAHKNLSLAVDFFLNEPMASTIQIGSFSIYPQALSSANVPSIATRLAGASGNPKAGQVLQRLLQAWSEVDIDATVAWVTANEPLLDGSSPAIASSRIPGAPTSSGSASLLAGFADSYARRDLDRALRLAETLTPAQRGAWIQSALSAVADPREALRRLESYRAEPFYEATYSNILQRSALTGSPQVIADLLGAAPAATREFLLPQVAQRFAEVDPKGARDWALSHPAGAERDGIVSAMLSRFASAGEFDANLLSKIDNPATRQSSLMQAFVAIGRVDKETALRMFDEHYEDPALRAKVEESIDRTRARTEQFRREINTIR